MLRPLLLATLPVLLLGTASAPTIAAPVVVTSPQALPSDHTRPRVFLGGSIDMGHATDWQADLIAALKDQDVTVLNPRRMDWNPAWKPEASDPNFRQQVQWELAALDSADVIVMYLAPGTQSPVSLMELGLHAHDGKLIVLCPQGYWRKGNVDITAARYGVQQVATMDELIAATKARIAGWKPGRGPE